MSVYVEALTGVEHSVSEDTNTPSAMATNVSEANQPRSLDHLITPALIGGYAVIGVYVGRNALGSRGELSWSSIALVAGTSAASAYAAPFLSQMVVCPRSPSAPLVEAAISSAISWQLLAMTTGAQSATMFVPVQLGAHIAGKYIAPRLWNPLRSLE
jgi:hypothetical protein